MVINITTGMNSCILTARAVNFRGVAFAHPLEFSNDEVGFHALGGI